jgi:hypothetical protein
MSAWAIIGFRFSSAAACSERFDLYDGAAVKVIRVPLHAYTAAIFNAISSNWIFESLLRNIKF